MKPFRAFGGTVNTVKELRWHSFSRIGHRRDQAMTGIQPASLRICRNLAAVFGTSITVTLNKWRCQHPISVCPNKRVNPE